MWMVVVITTLILFWWLEKRGVQPTPPLSKDIYLLPTSSQVVSGGVASNGYIRHALSRLCDHTSYKLVCPPPKLCTDNGIMVAWAGMEHLKLGTGLADNPQEVRFEPR